MPSTPVHPIILSLFSQRTSTKQVAQARSHARAPRRWHRRGLMHEHQEGGTGAVSSTRGATSSRCGPVTSELLPLDFLLRRPRRRRSRPPHAPCTCIHTSRFSAMYMRVCPCTACVPRSIKDIYCFVARNCAQETVHAYVDKVQAWLSPSLSLPPPLSSLVRRDRL
jgi:hypothetical protein